MPILIKNESFNNIFLWKLCFIENNYFLCIVKLKKRRIMKYVIIGGVAGGATAAARLRRVDEMAEILLLEKGPYISYANCGLPYYIGGVIAENVEIDVVQATLNLNDILASHLAALCVLDNGNLAV